MGAGLPLASGSPSFITSQTKALTFPFSPIISFGAANHKVAHPSNLAISNSCCVQFFSASDLL